MSTTVTYKGQVLTSFTADTKKLLTAGKYMEDDVTIQDTSSLLLPVGYVFGIHNVAAPIATFVSTVEENP